MAIGLGRTASCRGVIPAAELLELNGTDGYILRAAAGPGAAAPAAPAAPAPAAAASSVLVCVASNTGVGVAIGALALLQEVGWAFLHPMRIVAPLGRPAGLAAALKAVSSRKAPALAFRGSHVHAEHPSELANVLNGFDAGGGWEDRAAWQVLVPEWCRYLLWALAQGQNHVEWSLLSGKAYAAFDVSVERQSRLAALVALAKSLGFAVGIDAPFTQEQEHGWRVWNTPATDPDPWAHATRPRLDYLMHAGFDYIQSELGTSELTEGGSVLTLMRLLNQTAAHLNSERFANSSAPTARFMLESHVSGGQTVPGLPDPLHPGQDLNFNWLPYYFDPSIVTRPHTVQIHSLAPTYGGTNFSATVDFIKLMTHTSSVNGTVHGPRDVVWYPETNYWCNYDVDVPLFLAPIYALSRLDDLRRVQAAAQPSQGRRAGAASRPLAGQAIFESGWQWCSYLQNVVATRAQWVDLVCHGGTSSATMPACPATAEVLATIMAEAFWPLAAAAALTSPAQPNATALATTLADIAALQHSLVVLGTWAGAPPKSYEMTTGQAYLQGFDAMADVFFLLKRHANLSITSQPDRLPLTDFLRPVKRRPKRSNKNRAGRGGDFLDFVITHLRVLVRPNAHPMGVHRTCRGANQIALTATHELLNAPS